MNAAEETRKQWASLLAGRGDLQSVALQAWLRLAAQAVGADLSQSGIPDLHEPRAAASGHGSPAGDAGPREGGNGAVPFNPLALMAQSLDAWQRLAQGWLEPQGENPLARWLGHPAVAVDTSNSPSTLMMESGLAFAELLRSAFSHETLRLQGWANALQKFAEEFNSDAGTPVIVDSLDRLFTHWSVVGEAAMQEHSRSEAYLQSQADMLQKSMRLRIAQRRTIEAVSRSIDVPTLSDLDEAFASIHALKAETRRLRRLVEAQARAQVQAQVPAVEVSEEVPATKGSPARGRARSAA